MKTRHNPLVRIRTKAHETLIGLVRNYYNVLWGTQIGEGSRVSLTTKIDRTNPAGVIIGKHSACAFGSAILTHDFVNGVHRETRIGDYCFIGARATIMPGVTIGDHCIIGTGAVVMRDVPSHSIVMGNPARVIEKDIMTGEFGKRIAGASAAALPAATPATDDQQ
ncbi:acyltransferase [Sphingomonas morindae]|uniref:acyltransferase n=1 Tax=Sphingomonas morindae TaxID=1541170 RepID=UPI0026767E91|nr:acyltransferase [Sphingomonas morindae]